MTNKEFSQKDQTFQAACEAVPWGKDKEGNPKTLPPSKRQASKWRLKRGLAYKVATGQVRFD